MVPASGAEAKGAEREYVEEMYAKLSVHLYSQNLPVVVVTSVPSLRSDPRPQFGQWYPLVEKALAGEGSRDRRPRRYDS